MDFYKAMADQTPVFAKGNESFAGKIVVVNFYDMTVRIRNTEGHTLWVSMDLVTPVQILVSA